MDRDRPPPPDAPARAACLKAVEIAEACTVHGGAVVEAAAIAAYAVVAKLTEDELAVCGPPACHSRRQGASRAAVPRTTWISTPKAALVQAPHAAKRLNALRCAEDRLAEVAEPTVSRMAHGA